MAQYVKKDPQNPYRFGVLCGNYVEDKFGQEIAEKQVSLFFMGHFMKIRMDAVAFS